jgi:lysophospholipase L1-like esterase
MQLANNDTLLFTGDSITDCGRVRPLGEGAGLGDGYVALVDAFLAAQAPGRQIRVLNTGIGGNRVTDLEARWQSDVLDLEPDWLSIMIGVNDVWRQFDSALNPNQVTIERFEEVYRRLLEQTLPVVKGLVMMAPYMVEPDRSQPMRAKLDAYGKVVAQLASEFDAVFIDMQAIFDHYLAPRAPETITDDKIHVNLKGHAVIAAAVLAALA